MTNTARPESETRLAAALARRGLADPRPAYRERLRALRDANPPAFEQAKARFEQIVRDTEEADEVERWIEYGQFLGDLTSPGRLQRIDEHGTAEAWSPPLEAGCMLLHLPEDSAAPALAVVLPARMSEAQEATHSLLVARRLSL